MRISVRSRPCRHGVEPCAFCLGRAQLWIAAILERRESDELHAFDVRVLDGRRFLLHHRPQEDAWELGRVYPRCAKVRRRRVRSAYLAAGRALERQAGILLRECHLGGVRALEVFELIFLRPLVEVARIGKAVQQHRQIPRDAH